VIVSMMTIEQKGWSCTLRRKVHVSFLNRVGLNIYAKQGP
jgi:hypothetical protein